MFKGSGKLNISSAFYGLQSSRGTITVNDGKVKVGKVNVDEQEDLAARFNVMSIPTLMVFKDGKSVKREMGAKDKEGILAMLA